MGLFEHWPYTNFHDLNLDWIITKLKEVVAKTDNIDQIIDDRITELETDAQAIINSRPVNVLTLGVKNDGSADCSTIINEATKKYQLYFPDGTYLVSSPLYIKNSIYGSGNDIDFTRIGMPRIGATLLSNINGVASEGVLVCNDYHVNIENLNIKCYSNECGILINTARANERFSLKNLTIFNIAGYGIECIPANANSRILTGKNLYIYGQGSLSQSVGIHINNKSYDSLIENSVINAVQTGIINDETLRLNDVHIWTGMLENVNPEWWANTKSLYIKGSLFATDTYLDTSASFLYVDTSRPVTLYNTLIWNSISQIYSSTYSNQKIIRITDNIINQSLITMNGLTYRDMGRMSLPTENISGRLGQRINDVTIISNNVNEPSNGVMGCVGRLYDIDSFKTRIENNQLVEIANIAARYGGCAELEIFYGSELAKIDFSLERNPRFKITYQIETQEKTKYYYKEYNDSAGNRCYKVYAHYVARHGNSLTVNRKTVANAFMTSYYNSRPDGTRLIPETLTTTEGLTEITE